MLFSFTVSAQVDKGAKNERPVKGQSSYSSDSKPSVKPTELKPANEVNNDRPTKPVGKGTTSVNKPNVKEKSAARPQSTMDKEQRDPSAARSAARPVNTMQKEQRDPSAARSAARPVNTMEKEQRDPSAARNSSKTSAAGVEGGDAEFCKGWKDGYIKGWNIDKDEFEKPNRIPECTGNPSCEGYKCGYKMGMKKAEIDRR